MVASSLDALDEHHDEKIDRRPYARTENLSALCVNLAKLLEGQGKFILVLDAVDKVREAGGTSIAALGRLGEIVRSPTHIPYYLRRHTTNNPHRYLIFPSSLQQPYRSHPPPCTGPAPHPSTSHPTHAHNSSPFSHTTHLKSSSRRPPPTTSQTTRPTSPPKTTPGCGRASHPPYTTA